MRTLLFLLALLLLPASWLRAQQSNLSFTEHAGSFIDVDHQHVPWPSPEAMFADLRSPDDPIRLKALERLGLTGGAYRDIWSEGDQPKVIGKRLITPDQVRLTYAALGSDAEQQAILAVELDDLQTTIVAVMTPAAHGWQRIAQTTCWCKYDLPLDGDGLSIFAQLRPAAPTPNHGPNPRWPQLFELVVHESGGGSGIDVQDEAHFRMHDGELREVLGFTSRRVSCPPAINCRLDRRWFTWSDFAGGLSGVLVEGHATFSAQPGLLFEVRDLETRHLQHFTCTRIHWSEQRFRYERAEHSAGPCKTATPGSKRD